MAGSEPGNPSARHVASSLPRSSPPSALAFLVHSQETVEQNLPPDVDNKPLARQKRRRTSPEDQKILELEYQRNPKPDKATRLLIVQRVALGEKEVQIWFQNRRQSSRRRSQPLPMSDASAPSSFSSDGANSDGLPSSDPVAEPEDDTSNAVNRADDVTTIGVSREELAGSSASSPVDASIPLPPADASETQETAIPFQSTADEPSNCATPLTEHGESPEAKKADEQQQGPGSCSSQALEEPSTESPQPREPDRSLKRTTSSFRLSMTADGHATVLASDEASPPPPSPEKPRPEPVLPAASRSLNRSQSLMSFAGRTGTSSIPRGAPGRSRDSRTWEFYCDSQSRNLLTQTADQENSGSAADAIGLIRSNSKKALQPSKSKRNAVLNVHNPAKRQKTDSRRKSQLERSASSFGRLQGKENMPPQMASEKAKKGTDEWEKPETESDKENWDPNHEAGHGGQQATTRPSRQRRRVLGENTTLLSESASLGAMMDREQRQKKRAAVDEPDPEGDEELASFMGSGLSSGRASFSSGEDFDCIQGLLRLSQGNWK